MPSIEAHTMSPAVVLGTLAAPRRRGPPRPHRRLRAAIVDEGIGLSAPVAAAVERAVDEVVDIGRRSRSHQQERSTDDDPHEC